MSGITIFSAAGCSHCARLKSAIHTHNLPYTDICLSKYPEKIFDLFALCQKNSIPQVFFNGENIGNADETISLLKQWKQQHQPSPIQVFHLSPPLIYGPIDIRLTAPIDPPRKPPPAPPRMNAKNETIQLPGDEEGTASILEVTSILMIILPRDNLSYHAVIYKDCFTGKSAVSAIMEHFYLSDVSEAVEFGKMLQSHQVLDHVCGNHSFGNTNYYYRLQCNHQPKVLNSFRIWNDRIDSNFMGLASRLFALMLKIEENARDEGSENQVDYMFAESDPHYLLFEEEVCELQGIHMHTMDETQRVAFCINVYNLMIKHAFIKVGSASTWASRSAFYNEVCYNIGGSVLSFDEIEHGVIRGNARPPYQMKAPLPSSGSKAKLAVSKRDARVHFALNCGGKSCPPVRQFTVENLDKELDIVTRAFCENEENVQINEDKHELILSMIFKWYRSDFADAVSKLPNFIVRHLSGSKKEALERMMQKGMSKKGGKNSSTMDIKFKPYDWSVLAAYSKQFESKEMKVNEKSLRSLFFKGKNIDHQTSAKNLMVG